MGRLEGKVAIVTGAATGIGKAIAVCFAGEGAAVTVDHVEFQQEQANAVVREIEGRGGKAIAVRANVTNQGEIEQLVDETVAKFGRLDILINNAGVETRKPFLDTSLEEWKHVVDVDLTGPWICSQAATRQMVKQGDGGRIINISSVHEDLPMVHNIPYCAAKGGLRMLMRTLCDELAPHKITVNNIAPGAIDTNLDHAVEVDPALHKKLLAEIPLNRMGHANEVAGLALYLASDAAAYVTGSTYFIDGGMMRHAGSL